MLAAKDNWASLFILAYVKKPLKLANWRKIFEKFAPELDFDAINVYSETVDSKDNGDGTFTITNGTYKKRYSNGAPYIEVVKANFRKKNHAPITVAELADIKSKFKSLNKFFTSTTLEIPTSVVKIDHIGIDYYPYKDPFKIDKGKPKNPPLPTNWAAWGIALAGVFGIVLVASKKKKN